jgi:hypothetical protein
MSDHLAREPVRSRRVYPRRIHRVAANRLTGVDMRSRVGKAYTSAFICAVREFPAAPADRVAEVARLRAIATLAQQAALVGTGGTDAALRATAAADRCARDLAGQRP